MRKGAVIELRDPEGTEDALTQVLRDVAGRLVSDAVEAEFAEFLGRYADLKSADGRRRVVRNGYLPRRELQTGLGARAA